MKGCSAAGEVKQNLQDQLCHQRRKLCNVPVGNGDKLQTAYAHCSHNPLKMIRQWRVSGMGWDQRILFRHWAMHDICKYAGKIENAGDGRRQGR